LWQDVLVQYLIADSATPTPLGLVQAYRADLAAGHCYLAALLASAHQRRGWPIEGIELFVDHLFATWAFEKVYLEVASANLDQFRSVEKFCRQEGTLRGHVVRGEVREDLHILALYRDDWEKRREGEAQGSALSSRRSVAQVLVAEFGKRPEEVSSGSRFFEDLGFDSLSFLDLLVRVWPDTEGDLPDSVRTVGELESALLGWPTGL